MLLQLEQQDRLEFFIPCLISHPDNIFETLKIELKWKSSIMVLLMCMSKRGVKNPYSAFWTFGGGFCLVEGFLFHLVFCLFGFFRFFLGFCLVFGCELFRCFCSFLFVSFCFGMGFVLGWTGFGIFFVIYFIWFYFIWFCPKTFKSFCSHNLSFCPVPDKSTNQKVHT